MSPISRFFPHYSLLFVLVLCAALPVTAEIYKWTDSNGKTHYADAVPQAKSSQAADVQTVTLDNINTFTDVSISEAPGWTGFYKPEVKPGVKNVVMYSTARCGYCKQARAYFQSRNISFVEKKIDEDPAAMDEYRQLGATGVPVILIGRQRMDGFRQSSFDKVFYGDNPPS